MKVNEEIEYRSILFYPRFNSRNVDIVLPAVYDDRESERIYTQWKIVWIIAFGDVVECEYDDHAIDEKEELKMFSYECTKGQMKRNETKRNGTHKNLKTSCNAPTRSVSSINTDVRGGPSSSGGANNDDAVVAVVVAFVMFLLFSLALLMTVEFSFRPKSRWKLRGWRWRGKELLLMDELLEYFELKLLLLVEEAAATVERERRRQWQSLWLADDADADDSATTTAKAARSWKQHSEAPRARGMILIVDKRRWRVGAGAARNSDAAAAAMVKFKYYYYRDYERYE